LCREIHLDPPFPCGRLRGGSEVFLDFKSYGDITFLSFSSRRKQPRRNKNIPMKTKLEASGKVIFALTLIHFSGDFFSSFVTPLLPTLAHTFSLSLTQVGLLTGINRFMAFLVQPSVGYLADNYHTRIFVLGGPLMAICFIPLIGIAPGFFTLILFVALGSIGSSMFHPVCAGMVSTYAGRHFGFSMSIFNMGGTLAFAVGPLFITTFVRNYGLRALPLTMVIGLAIMALLVRIVPTPQSEGLSERGFMGSLREAFGSAWRYVLLLWAIMVLRSYVGQSFMTFVPILYTKHGYSLVSVGAIVSLFTLAGALSGLLAGHLSDRVGYRPIFLVAHFLTTPCLLLFLHPAGTGVYFAAFLSGFMALATLPLGVAMAQELAPKGKSMVSSLMMGLAFGTGGMMAPLTGKLADIYSIQAVLGILAFIPLASIALILLLPGRIGGEGNGVETGGASTEQGIDGG